MPCADLFLLQVDCQGQVGCLLPSSARTGKVLIIRYWLDLAISTLQNCLIDRPIAARSLSVQPCPGTLNCQLALSYTCAQIAAQCQMGCFKLICHYDCACKQSWKPMVAQGLTSIHRACFSAQTSIDLRRATLGTKVTGRVRTVPVDGHRFRPPVSHLSMYLLSYLHRTH